MPAYVPYRFLVRLAHPCPYVPAMPRLDDDDLLAIPASGRLRTEDLLSGQAVFADVRLGWNEHGLGVQAEVRGKRLPPAGDRERPRSSDGLSLWIDTRDARRNHRASRFCHQFAFLVTGDGPDRDQPFVVQLKIPRALQDAPLADPARIPLRVHRRDDGYRLAAFLPAAVLHGYDPEEHRRLGVYYVLRDHELGDQFLHVGWDFPFSEDPSLWDVLELTGPPPAGPPDAPGRRKSRR